MALRSLAASVARRRLTRADWGLPHTFEDTNAQLRGRLDRSGRVGEQTGCLAPLIQFPATLGAPCQMLFERALVLRLKRTKRMKRQHLFVSFVVVQNLIPA